MSNAHPSASQYQLYQITPSTGDSSRTENVISLRAQSSEILHEELFPLPPPSNCPPRPLSNLETARVETLSRLQFFLATAPTRWGDPVIESPPSLQKFQLPNGENVSCVLWRGLFHISGTDVVRALAFRFEAFGRPVRSSKKWEEGVFSDLRNLKPGMDAALEEPKSPLLEFLFRNGCIRTQKKQKVFYWFSVPHDRLFLDALERDLKREKAGQEPTSMVTGEPAMSFRYDPKRTLFEQFAGKNPGLGSPASPSLLSAAPSSNSGINIVYSDSNSQYINDLDFNQPNAPLADEITYQPPPQANADNPREFKGSLLPGSSEYKRRRTTRRLSSVLQSSKVTLAAASPHGQASTISRAWTSSPRMLCAIPPPSVSDSVPAETSTSLLRTYTCMYEQCKKRFKRLEHLKRHVRTHTNERPFFCEACLRSFTRQDNLVQHLKTHQKGGQISERSTTSPHDIIRRRSRNARSPEHSNVDQRQGLVVSHLGIPPHKSAPVTTFTDSQGYHRSFTAPPDWINQMQHSAREPSTSTPLLVPPDMFRSPSVGSWLSPDPTNNISDRPAYSYFDVDSVLHSSHELGREASLPFHHPRQEFGSATVSANVPI